jgi:hypothetical protein
VKIEGFLFALGSAFYLAIAGIYWYFSRDQIGTTALALTGALAFLVAFYVLYTSKRVYPRPEDRMNAEVDEALVVAARDRRVRLDHRGRPDLRCLDHRLRSVPARAVARRLDVRVLPRRVCSLVAHRSPRGERLLPSSRRSLCSTTIVASQENSCAPRPSALR